MLLALFAGLLRGAQGGRGLDDDTAPAGDDDAVEPGVCYLKDACSGGSHPLMDRGLFWSPLPPPPMKRSLITAPRGNSMSRHAWKTSTKRAARWTDAAVQGKRPVMSSATASSVLTGTAATRGRAFLSFFFWGA